MPLTRVSHQAAADDRMRRDIPQSALLPGKEGAIIMPAEKGSHHERGLNVQETDRLLEQLLKKLAPLSQADGPVLAAIDGRCGSGKSRLAGQAAAVLGCSLFHMDDFFLPPALRTPERLAQPGGNIHYERVAAELLVPWSAGKPVCFRPFDCHSGGFGPPVQAAHTGLALVEGSYALHPELYRYYHTRIFLTCSPAVQRQRLLEREGTAGLARFQARWIPLEEAYFQTFRLPERCDLVLDTGRS